MTPEEYKSVFMTEVYSEAQKMLKKIEERDINPLKEAYLLLERDYNILEKENKVLKEKLKGFENISYSKDNEQKKIKELEEVKRYRDMAARIRREKVVLLDTIERMNEEK